MHIPEGATPKDGPSAGITMVTSLLSLLLNHPVRQDLGMTGELTLTGKVLPIGGLKEKLIAAKRSGAKVLIFPKENLRDYDELPEYLKNGLEVHFVDYYDEVFSIAFGQEKSSSYIWTGKHKTRAWSMFNIFIHVHFAVDITKYA